MAAKKIKIDNASFKFKKQTQRREQKVIRCSVLIVCEGTKTEPNYFDAFAQKQQGIIVYDIEVKGLGRGTKDVVEKAIALKNKNNYAVMTTYGSMDSAMRYAESKHLEYTDSRYANQNPCTTVYRLVRQLLGKDEGLNNELISKIDEN